MSPKYLSEPRTEKQDINQIVFSGLRKVYPYYFTFTTFTKGRWVGEKILDVFAREFRAHPVEEYVSASKITKIRDALKKLRLLQGQPLES